MFDNVDSRFLPPPEHRPAFTFGAPSLHYAWSRRTLNACEELLDATIARHGPGRTAITHLRPDGGVDEWSYGRLAGAVHRLAGGLRALGVGPGDRVLTRFGETPLAAVSQLAVWRIGALVVPCAAVETARELGFILQDTEPAAVISESAQCEPLVEALAEHDRDVLVIGCPGPVGGGALTVDAVSEGRPDSTPAAPTGPFDGSGIYYTGGTTGLPKGCLHTHVSEIALADLNLAARGAGADDVFLSHAPIGHAFGNGEKINFPLRAGGRVVYVDRPSPETMWQAIAEQRVSVLAGAATMYRMMLRVAPGTSAGTLRSAVSSGEVLDPTTAAAWQQAQDVVLRNTVGMTPMRHLFLESGSDGVHLAPATSVGAPLPGYEARLVGPDGEVVCGAGETGRLAVRGPSGITYWTNAHPRIGERARADVRDGWSLLDDAYVRDAEGWLYFHGRLDDMVVTGGRQVAPIEVEQVLSEHPAVAEVAVIGTPDEIRGQVVCAVVKVHDPARAGAELVAQLQEHAKRLMAGYKYPRRVEFVAELPKDGVGKIQRRRLRERFAQIEQPLSSAAAE